MKKSVFGLACCSFFLTSLPRSKRLFSRRLHFVKRFGFRSLDFCVKIFLFAALVSLNLELISSAAFCCAICRPRISCLDYFTRFSFVFGTYPAPVASVVSSTKTRAHSFFGFCMICFGTVDFPALFSSSRVSGAQSCWSVFSSRAGCPVTFPVGLGLVRLHARESIEAASLVSCQGLIFFGVVFSSACCECAGQDSCARLGATGIPLKHEAVLIDLFFSLTVALQVCKYCDLYRCRLKLVYS
jgi:hypothetical protein